MRFLIEQRYLTDSIGTPVVDDTLKVTSRDGADAETVLASFIADDGATGVGTAMLYRGYQALIFARKGDALYALYAYPGDLLAVSDQRAEA